MNKEFLSMLVCPRCKGPLTYRARQQTLLCEKERLLFPVRKGCPVLLIEEAVSLSRQGET